MKNNYQFLHLIKESYQDLVANQEEIFFKIMDFVDRKDCFSSGDDFKKLKNIMNDGMHLIGNKLVAYKGKKRMFKGVLHMATKNNILNYLNFCFESNDLRSIVISPVFEQIPKYVILIHEDAFYFVYMDKSIVENGQ